MRDVPTVMAGGFLPSGASVDDKSPYTSNCVAAREATDGTWDVLLDEPFDLLKHYVVAMVVAVATTDGVGVQLGLVTVDGRAGFKLTAVRNIGAMGTYIADDLDISFTVHKKPA